MVNRCERTNRGTSNGVALADRPRRAAGRRSWRRAAATQRRILVVEDDYAIGAMLEGILGLEGFNASVVGDGSRALAALHSSAFDALIVDVMLPGLNGLEIVRAVRAHPRTAEMPILILTGNDDARSTWEGWRSGCDCYLTKPFDPTHLIGQLNRLVGASRGGGR